MTKEIGARVRVARERAGMTRAQLADLLEIDISVLGRIENGKVGLSSTRLLVVAKLLDVRASELLGEEPAAVQE